MEKYYLLMFNKIKKIILREFTIQILYVFVLLKLLPFFVNISHYNSFILLADFILLYLSAKAVSFCIAEHPRLILVISACILFTLLAVVYFKKYEIAKYVYSLRVAMIINKFDFYFILPVISFSMLIFIIVYMFLKEKMYFFVTPAACLILITLTWYLIEENKYKGTLIVFIFTFFTDLLLYIYNKNKAKGIKNQLNFNVNKKLIFKYGTVMIVAMLLFCMAVSNIFGTKSIEQIRRDELTKKLKNINAPLFDSLTSKLGGSVNLKDKILFKIRGDAPSYLIGSIKDYYSGTSWKNSFTEYANKTSSPFYRNKTYKTLMGEKSNKKLNIRTMEIIPVDAPWKTMFIPNNIYNISSHSNEIAYNNGNYCCINLSKTKDEPYYIDYYESKTNLETIYSSKENYLNYNTKSQQFLSKYSEYLEIPDSITDRTRNLVSDITKDCKNNTEKVTAIKNYLSNTFNYTTEVEELPRGKEFVDYFLFEQKEGYCTYFATACAVMLRIAGIPSRYAEGYYIDKSDYKDGYFNIKENNGHAFAEVLVNPEANLWSIVESTSIATSQGHSYIPPYALTHQNSYQQTNNNNAVSRTNTNESKNKSRTFLSHIYGIYAVIILLTIIIVNIVILTIINKMKIHRLIQNESIIPFYNCIRDRLNSMGYMKNSNETDYNQVKEIYDYKLKEILFPVVEGYYQEFYGEENTDIDRRSVYEEFEKHLKEKQGFILYWSSRIKSNLTNNKVK